MKRLKINYLLIPILFATALVSCRKDKRIIEPPVAERAGVYVLNQGSFGASNSTLTYYDYITQKLTRDKFSEVNGTTLGAVGNDVQVYGSKMYIVVNVSSKLEVANAKTLKSIKSIPFKNGNIERQPRFITFYLNKAFISSYDGTVAVLDTATLTIEKYIPVGRNPEQLTVADGKLYVANSGGLDFGNPDTTVSVIDLKTLNEIKKITVAANPVSIAADRNDNVFLISNGNFADIKPTLTIIDGKTGIIRSQKEGSFAYGSPIDVAGPYALVVTADNKIRSYDHFGNIEEDNLIKDGTEITNAYSVALDPINGDLFVGDANNFVVNGELFVFGTDGKKKYSIETGINPGRILFVNK